MKFGHYLATAGLLAVASTAAFAQVGSRAQIYSEMVPPEKGTAEIGLAADIKLDDDSAYYLQLKWLPYMNRNVQLGGSLSYENVDAADFSGGFVELRGDYNFLSPDEATTKRTVPYAGLAIGTAFGDYGDYINFHWGIHGGVKHFVSNDISIFAELNYRKFDTDEPDYDSVGSTIGGTDDDDLRILIGINTYLRK